MKYNISKEILEKFPTTCLGIIAIRDIDNSNSNEQILKLLRQSKNHKVLKKYQSAN